MKKTKKRRLLIGALLAPLILILPSVSSGMSINQAVALALANNPDLQKQQMNLSLSAEEINIQESLQFGKVDALMGYDHFNNARTLTPLTPNSILAAPELVPTTEDFYRAGVAYAVPLFTGYAQQNSIAVAKLEKEMSGVAIKLSREQLIYNVKSIYVNILSLEATKKAQQTYYSALKYLYEDVKLQVKVGKTARVDLLKAAADMENSRVKIEQSSANIKIMKSSLGTLLNTKHLGTLENSSMVIRSKIRHEYNRDFKDLDRYRSTVLMVEKNSRLVEKSKSGYYPQIDFRAYYGENFGPNDDSNKFVGEWNNATDWSMGISLKWSIFDFGTRKASTQKAALRKMQSQKDQLSTELELDRSLGEAEIQMELAVENYKSAKVELAFTRETERIEQIRYDKGAADMDDLLYAKARNHLALSRSITAQYAYQTRRFYLDYLLENGENK